MKRVISLLFLFGIMVVLSASAWAVSIKDFKLNGFFDLEYEKADGPGHPTSPVGDEKGSFDQYHFNLLMEFPVSDKLSVKGHIEYEHGPQTSPDKGKIYVEWSYLEYALSDSVSLRGGMMITPFGIYNEILDATPTYHSIRTPWGIYKTTSVGSKYPMFPKFSTGASVLGNYLSTDGNFQLNYVLYVSNGENSTNNEAEKDDNGNKAIGGRVMVSPVAGLTVGGSYYTGKKQIATATAATAYKEENHSAWIGSVEWNLSPFALRTEYASSNIGDTTQTGWYGEVSYVVTVRSKDITPYLRYGVLDPDDNQGNDKWIELIYGINYEIEPNFILKIENRQFNGNPSNTKVSEDYNEIGAAVVVAF